MTLLLGWMAALLGIALLPLWLVCFPEPRQALGQYLRRRMQAVIRRLNHVVSGFTHIARQGMQQTGVRARSARSLLTSHWRILTAVVLLLAIPPVLIVSLRRHVALDGYDATEHADAGTTTLVASLLKGEQLTPPPALPPAVFVTREVEMVRPGLGFASRNWDNLDAVFRQRLLIVFRIMKERYGYDMALIEGYRSPQRQAELAAQGGSVTHVGAWQSYHQYGLAADCAFYRDGKLVISEKDPWAMRGYQLYGEVAQAAGLVWGGSWKMLDLGHVELHEPGKGPGRHR